MDVVAFLPPLLLQHLLVVLAPDHTVVPAASWTEVLRAVRTQPVDVLVLDPGTDGMVGTAEVVLMMQRFPSVPVVLYVALSPAGMKAVGELGRHGARQVVLQRFDDDPIRFRAVLELQQSYVLGDRLLDAIRPGITLLTPLLRAAVERMVRQPSRFQNADELAAAARVTYRTLFRHFASAGLASPRSMVVGARLLRAYSYMRDPGADLLDVAVKSGYSAPRILTRNMMEAIGISPARMRRWMESDEFIRRLAAWMHPAPVDPLRLSTRSTSDDRPPQR